jgi:hypothetical protein
MRAQEITLAAEPGLVKRSLPHLKIVIFAFVALSLALGTYVYISKNYESEPVESAEPAGQPDPAFSKEESLQAELENMKYQLNVTQSQLEKLQASELKATQEIKLYKKELSQYKTRFGDLKAKPTVAKVAVAQPPKPVLEKQVEKPEHKPARLAAASKAIPKLVLVPRKKKPQRKVISVTFSEDGTIN